MPADADRNHGLPKQAVNRQCQKGGQADEKQKQRPERQEHKRLQHCLTEIVCRRFNTDAYTPRDIYSNIPRPGPSLSVATTNQINKSNSEEPCMAGASPNGVCRFAGMSINAFGFQEAVSPVFIQLIRLETPTEMV